MPQASNSIAEALHGWMRGCPLLRTGARVGMDYLAENPTEYAIYATPSNIRYTENVLGEAVPAPVQTLNFIFASHEPFGADIGQMMRNEAFYEAVMAWIWTQNEKGNFPTIPGGTVKSIVPTLTTFIAEAGSDTARYQIQLHLTYRRA